MCNRFTSNLIHNKLKTPEVKFSWIQPFIQDKSPETQVVNYFALFELFSALCVLQENQRMSRNPAEAKGRSGNIKSWRTHYRWGPSWNGSKLAWLENSWFQEITATVDSLQAWAFSCWDFLRSKNFVWHSTEFMKFQLDPLL